MNCLIIDDNKIARTTMKQLVSQNPDLVLLAECEDATEAYKQIMATTVDLLLLDIEMPGMSGIDLVKNLGLNRPLIIFTTSKKEYAAEAFDLNVVDYITKPVYPIRFLQAIEKAKDVFQSNKEDVKIVEDEFLFVRDSNIVRRININDILFAEAMGDYVKLFLQQKYYAIHSTLKAVEEKLPANKFLRVHRSYIVQLSKIDTVQRGMLQINGRSVPVADAYRAVLNKRMQIL
ncbi:MAG: LytTR family DNA-binding domain-containing protein [Ferruginibacter sp.]